MARREPVPSDILNDLLFQSGRRCCICYGLDHDLNVKTYGKIVRLNRNSADNRPDNLAYLCLEHHNVYETGTPLVMGDVKKFRASLYAEIDRMRRKGSWPTGFEVPYLNSAREAEAEPNVLVIHLADSDLNNGSRASLLHMTFQYHSNPDNTHHSEKWLHIEVIMRPAMMLRIQVRAWTDHETLELVRFLREGGRGCELHSSKPQNGDLHTGDYLYLWQESGEYRMSISTVTAAHAGIAIHARFSDQVARALADYLDKVGFAVRSNGRVRL
jgi:hypothetical protein